MGTEMRNDRGELRSIISILDVVSMIMILLYHSIHWFFSAASYESVFMMRLSGYLVNYGMATFTFSSGFKLVYNHIRDFKVREFYKVYLVKRAKYLYGIYLFYPIVCIIFYRVVQRMGLQEVTQNYLAPGDLGKIGLPEWIHFFFGAAPPVAGHVWFLFVLLLITIIVMCMLALVGVGSLYILFAVIFTIFLIYPHVLENISNYSEIPYYVFIYMTFYLMGCILAHIYTMKQEKIFDIAVIGLASVFVIIFVLDSLQYKGRIVLAGRLMCLLFKDNTFLRSGVFFPPFLFASLYPMRHTKVLDVFGKLKKDTLWIYLWQYPFCIPFFTKIILDIHLDEVVKGYVPGLVTMLTIVSCVVMRGCICKIIVRKKSL